MTTHTIEMLPSRYKNDTDHWISADHGRGGVVIRMHGKHQGHVSNFTICFVGLNGTSRREFQGPILPGPHASMFANCTVISAHKIEDPTVVLEVQEGDHLIINGFEYEIRDDRALSDPRLYLVKALDFAKK